MTYTPTPQELTGNFKSTALDNLLAAIRGELPPIEVPSDGIFAFAIVFLRALFYSLPPGNEFRWTGVIEGEEDENTTGIRITTDWPVNAETIEKRPIILLRLGGSAFQGFHLDGIKAVHVPTESKTRMDQLRGTLAITVLSRIHDYCRRLTEWIGINFKCQREALTFGGFHSINPQVQYSPIERATELIAGNTDHEYMQRTAIIGFSWDWTTRTKSTRQDLKLARVRQEIEALNRPMLDAIGPGSAIVVDELESFEQVILEPPEE